MAWASTRCVSADIGGFTKLALDFCLATEECSTAGARLDKEKNINLYETDKKMCADPKTFLYLHEIWYENKQPLRILLYCIILFSTSTPSCAFFLESSDTSFSKTVFVLKVNYFHKKLVASFPLRRDLNSRGKASSGITT